MQKELIVKSLTFEKSTENSDYDFAGYLAKYGNVDRHGDIIKQGAFKEAIDAKQNYVLHYDHDTGSMFGNGAIDNSIGYFKAFDKPDGVWIEAKFFEDTNDDKVIKAKQLVKSGAVNEMSIGFMASKGDVEYRRDANDEIIGYIFNKGLITEGSIVRVPANPEATIDKVKSLLPNEEVNKSVIDSKLETTVKELRLDKDQLESIYKKIEETVIKYTNEEEEVTETEEESQELTKEKLLKEIADFSEHMKRRL